MHVDIKHNQHFGYPYKSPEFAFGDIVRKNDDTRHFVVRGIYFFKATHQWVFEIDSLTPKDQGSYDCFGKDLQPVTPEELAV